MRATCARCGVGEGMGRSALGDDSGVVVLAPRRPSACVSGTRERVSFNVSFSRSTGEGTHLAELAEHWNVVLDASPETFSDTKIPSSDLQHRLLHLLSPLRQPFFQQSFCWTDAFSGSELTSSILLELLAREGAR